MSDDLDDDAFAREGVQAFNAMTAAMDRLGTTLTAVDRRQQIRLADEEAEASTARKAAQDAKQAADTALQAAHASARSVAAWAVLGALVGILGAGSVGYWFGHSSGHESGLADGYRAAQDEKAAAAWANTPAGQLAFALDRAGGLSLVTTCSMAGWWTETRQGHRYCFTGPAPNGQTYGWPLP